jgi:putative ATPase
LEAAEAAFFAYRDEVGEIGSAWWTWDGDTLEHTFMDVGFKTSLRVMDQQEDRLLTARDLSLWFDTEKSPWGAFIARALGDAAFARLREILHNLISRGPLVWRWKSLLLTAQV